MLRGGFGHALQALGCCGRPDDHAPDCPYRAIFKPVRPAHVASRFGDVPPAFVITPPAPLRGGTSPFVFETTLLGPAAAHRDLVMASWVLAGQGGLGPGAIPAVIRPVGELPLPVAPEGETLSLRLRSPLYIKHARTALQADQLSARELLAALSGRLALLHQMHDLLPDAVVPEAWIQQAGSMELRGDTRHVAYSRYSQRQRQAMPLQGLLGILTLDGVKDAGLRDALALGQWLHIGAKTSQGLGAYVLGAPSQACDRVERLPVSNTAHTETSHRSRKGAHA